MVSAEEDALQRELAECTLNKSWLFTLASVALSVPLSLRFKSYNPVVYCGLTGTMLDLVNGYSKCGEQRQALEDYQRAAREGRSV